MEIRFDHSSCQCLEPVLQQVQNQEQTQELRLGEGMPDVGSILGCWGQSVIRSKEWNGDTVSVSAGMMIWVLYSPEDGSQEQTLETWIPFQLRYDLAEGVPEGQLRVRCLTRFADARSVSARKLMIRAGMGVLAEGYVSKAGKLYSPTKQAGQVELKTAVYPLRLPREVGEKSFLLDEEQTIPEEPSRPEKIVSCRLEPIVTDKRVLGNKVAFRGEGKLSLLCRCADGSIRSWELALPFSQYAELDREHGADAQGDVALAVTSMEPELMEDGTLRIKAGVAAQYMISDLENAQVVEDAYCPGRELSFQQEELDLPVVLDSRTERVPVEQVLPAAMTQLVELRFLPDFPRVRQTPDRAELELAGSFCVLYYDTEGALRSGAVRWEGKSNMAADERCCLTVIPQAGSFQTASRGEGTQLQGELLLCSTAMSRRGIPVVSALELGEQLPADPNRPSLILRRREGKGLWEIAKESGSTVNAILRANGLSEEPRDDRMLLIPIR